MGTNFRSGFVSLAGWAGAAAIPGFAARKIHLPGRALPLLGLVLMSCTQPFGTGFFAADSIADATLVANARTGVNNIQWPFADPPPFHSQQFAQFVRNARSTPEVERTIRGALLYLYGTQIRDRPGAQTSLYDHCQPPLKTCESVLLVNNPVGSGYVGAKGLLGDTTIRNVAGEWANTIHFLPDRLGDANGESIIAIQDSNAFVTTGILYPLYFIDEGALPENRRLAEIMRSQAVASLSEYKRGGAYNFWIEVPGETSSTPKTGPLNLPIRPTQQVAEALSGPLYPLWQIYTAGLNVGVETWVRQALDRTVNPYGFDAVFNIPNDADDTATVVAIQKLHSVLQPRDHVSPDVAALRLLTRFRDLARAKRDLRNDWIGNSDSGAFLTWLKDENQDAFSGASSGIIPLGVNNIDCVVNANALFSMALNGGTQWAGFADARQLLVNVVRTRSWTEGCNLYYPQLMMFPYAFTRAYREGRLFNDPGMREAMGILLRDLLGMQESDGSFPGGDDKTRHLSTALAANALLNIGGMIADEEDLFNEYQSAIGKAIRFLVSERQRHHLVFSDANGSRIAAPGGAVGFGWDSGLFFSGSFGDLAHWRSEAYSTAIVLEALVKFSLAYDLDKSTLLSGSRLQLTSYNIEDNG